MSLAFNMELYNIAVRKQIYLEGVKASQYKEFDSVIIELKTELKTLLNKVKYKTLDGLTKAKLNVLIITLRKTQSKIYNRYVNGLIRQLKEFTKVDIELSKRVWGSSFLYLGKDKKEVISSRKSKFVIEKENEENPYLLPLFGLAFLKKGNDDIWKKIRNTPLPANGLYIQPFIKGFTVSAQAGVENIIRKGWANKTSIEDILEELLGDSVQGQASQLKKIHNQANAISATSFQHVSSIVNAAIISALYLKYTWHSVIDGVTSDICRDRNLNVYTFGKGPLPPAHPHCRSHISPTVGNLPVIFESVHAWFSKQSEEFKADVLSKEGMEAINKGRAKDFKKYNDKIPLTLDEYKSKIYLILDAATV